MAKLTQLFILIAAGFFILAAGCATPAGTQSSVITTTAVPSPVPVMTTAEVTTPPPATNVTVSATATAVTTTVPITVATTSVSPETTSNSTPQEIYYGNVAIFMDREGYAVVNFADIGYPILKPGEKYIVRITADHAILAYVIRSYDLGLLRTTDGVPVYNEYNRTYDYGRLLPVLKLENVYDGGAEFTVKDLGAYSLILDSRLAELDYHFLNEVTKVSVRILKVP